MRSNTLYAPRYVDMVNAPLGFGGFDVRSEMARFLRLGSGIGVETRISLSYRTATTRPGDVRHGRERIGGMGLGRHGHPLETHELEDRPRRGQQEN